MDINFVVFLSFIFLIVFLYSFFVFLSLIVISSTVHESAVKYSVPGPSKDQYSTEEPTFFSIFD